MKVNYTYYQKCNQLHKDIMRYYDWLEGDEVKTFDDRMKLINEIARLDRQRTFIKGLTLLQSDQKVPYQIIEIESKL